MSDWLARGLRDAGLPVTRMETRQVAAALSAHMEKTDRNDARGSATLLRFGWVRPVHLKSQDAQGRRLLLSARKTLQGRLVDAENSVRVACYVALTCVLGGFCASGGTLGEGS